MDCSARLFKGGHHLKNKIKTWFFLIFAKKSNSPPQKDEFKWRKQTKKKCIIYRYIFLANLWCICLTIAPGLEPLLSGILLQPKEHNELGLLILSHY